MQTIDRIVGDDNGAAAGMQVGNVGPDTGQQVITNFDGVAALTEIDVYAPRFSNLAGHQRQPRSSAMEGNFSANKSTTSPAITSRDTVRDSIWMSDRA